jgi:hypothetical protein
LLQQFLSEVAETSINKRGKLLTSYSQSSDKNLIQNDGLTLGKSSNIALNCSYPTFLFGGFNSDNNKFFSKRRGGSYHNVSPGALDLRLPFGQFQSYAANVQTRNCILRWLEFLYAQSFR